MSAIGRQPRIAALLTAEQQIGFSCSGNGMAVAQCPSRSLHPIAVLITVASYWFSSSLGPLKTTLKAELGITNAQYGVVSRQVSLSDVRSADHDALLACFRQQARQYCHAAGLWNRHGLLRRGVHFTRCFRSVVTIEMAVLALAHFMPHSQL